ncbi:MAG: TIGR00266 family protein [Halanaeroarchaeum sp.]
MRAEIRHADAEPTLVVGLGSGDAITAEAGTLVTVGEGVTMQRPEEGGVLDSIRKRLSDRTPVRVVRFVAETAGEVTLAPPLPGEIARIAIPEDPLYVVQAGSFLAAHDEVDLQSATDGGPTLRGEQLSFLQLRGTGPAFIAGYGAVEERRLNRGDRLTADAGHVIAFTGVSHELETVAGLKSAVFEDEGVVSRFRGPGRVWLQSRSHDAHLAWLQPQLAELS